MNTITQLRARGFTLIELLVVIAIIGLLSTIIAAPIQNARKKARDSKKIAEIKALQLAIEQYSEANLGDYPRALVLVAPTYMPVLPASAATSSAQVNNRDKYAYAPYFASGNEVQVGGAYFGYHIGAKLESYSQALDSDRDCSRASSDSDFAIVAGTSTCAFFPGADIVAGTYATTTMSNFVQGMIRQNAVATYPTDYDGTGGSDFDGSDNATTTCNSISDCIFDLTGQI